MSGGWVTVAGTPFPRFCLFTMLLGGFISMCLLVFWYSALTMTTSIPYVDLYILHITE